MTSKSAAFWEKLSRPEKHHSLPPSASRIPFPRVETQPVPDGPMKLDKYTYVSIASTQVYHATKVVSEPPKKAVEFDDPINTFTQISSTTPKIDNSADTLLQPAIDDCKPSTTPPTTDSAASQVLLPIESDQAVLNEYQELKAFLAPLRHTDVFAHAMGIRDLPDAPPLADSMHLRAVDVERWCRNQALTEIGFVSASRRGMKKVKTPGDHGINYLRKVNIVHQRIVPNAHLKNEIFCIGDPESSRFGPTVFVTLEQALEAMEAAFQMPINGSDPSRLCAIVIVGHDVKGDMKMLLETIKFEDQWGVIVAVIDTQQMAREVGWAGKNKISLKNLVAMVGFEYRDEHTPANDIGMTIICAMQACLPAEVKELSIRSLQEVVDAFEIDSRNVHPPEIGSKTYCLRCASWDHLKVDCKATNLHCTHCSKVGKARHIVRTHVEEVCITKQHWLANLAKLSKKCLEPVLDI